MSNVLDRVNLPRDLKLLSVEEQVDLCREIRGLIINTVSATGGHLAANLGAVEMTVALLKVFDPPADKILWDVGHQTYTYKILTGRKDRFCTLRQFGGLSGFQRRCESEYDAFGAGHSGTALSAGLGMAAARDQRGGREHIVVVLGDAAAGCGVSFEALNNVASVTDRIIVVLNDNEMSIAKNVGALSRYLGGMLSNPRYNRWKSSVESIGYRLRMGWMRSAYYKVEEAVKSLFLRSVFFEEFGLRYVGPIDGHNLESLANALTIARDYDKPILLHVATTKGKGYSLAEKFPEKWHGTSGFDIASGDDLAPKGDGPTYSAVFGSVLTELAAKDERIIAITAAMPSGTGLAGFAARFPDRLFDVGISEEHAAVFAAGLAAEGFRPVVAVYSTFAQRMVDAVIHDTCLQNLPVLFCLDRAGIVGDDGPTHHGVFDMALFRPVPGLLIMQPKDEAELAHMLFTVMRQDRPAVIRYPRGAGPGAPVPSVYEALPIGRAEVLEAGTDVQFWALGDMIPLARAAAALLRREGRSAGVVNARFVRPLDTRLLLDQAVAARLLVTIENGLVTGGFGSGVQEFVAGRGLGVRVLSFGWPDQYVPHGKPSFLMEQCGLTPEAISRAALAALADARAACRKA